MLKALAKAAGLDTRPKTASAIWLSAPFTGAVGNEDHNRAIREVTDIADALVAELSLEGQEFTPHRNEASWGDADRNHQTNVLFGERSLDDVTRIATRMQTLLQMQRIGTKLSVTNGPKVITGEPSETRSMHVTLTIFQ